MKPKECCSNKRCKHNQYTGRDRFLKQGINGNLYAAFSAHKSITQCKRMRRQACRSNSKTLLKKALQSDNFCDKVLVIDMGIKDSTNMPFAARRKPITAPKQKATTEA
ncbi:hypothetical protein MTR_1g083983 [Medicago truncatula]|uniref:Uncharacterized protein n=1 Tax=Medicago truncatula TaxID=3880 RepID=A0A072VYF2_MEDTR|nr:hypothetical protein MTR_1g083983 [Medicago truncatula]